MRKPCQKKKETAVPGSRCGQSASTITTVGGVLELLGVLGSAGRPGAQRRVVVAVPGLKREEAQVLVGGVLVYAPLFADASPER